MSTLFKRTKILATVGPSVFAEEKLKEMVYAGVNGFRLNFSHGTYDERDEQIRIIRKYAAERGKSVAIVQDLQGPKIRLGEIKGNHLDLKAGEEIVLDYAIKEHDGGKNIPVQYNLAEKTKVGEPIFLFDGKIKTIVKEIVSKTAIKVEVQNDGFVMSRKGVNLPDTDLGGDIFTEKDLADIEFGASRDFDYVAMSFVQSAADIEKMRQILTSHGSKAKIIAKIETKKAVESDESMEAIVKATDGIMIARGDMAIEAGAEVVPIVQRK
jgi:pyruvate kinase